MFHSKQAFLRPSQRWTFYGHQQLQKFRNDTESELRSA